MSDGAERALADRDTASEQNEPGRGKRLITLARWTLPFVVSGALLSWVFSGLDVRAVVGHVTMDVALIFVPALVVFVALTLLLEALCLVIVVSHTTPFHDWGVAARIKCASYLLGILNYALGAGALTVLLRRRARMPLSEAMGAVFVIGLFDLGSLLVLVIFGLALMGSDTPGVQAGVVVLAGLAILGGMVVLRAPISLGPLDRLRDLRVLHAARTLPLGLLGRLAALRFAFVGSFIVLAWLTLLAFDVHPPVLPLIINMCILLLVAALPVAAAGLGTGQVIWVALFEPWGDAETLLAASLLLSFGLIVARSAMGLFFAREFASEALAHRAEAEA